VRFTRVHNPTTLEKQLDSIRIGNIKLYVKHKMKHFQAWRKKISEKSNLKALSGGINNEFHTKVGRNRILKEGGRGRMAHEQPYR